MFCRRILRNLLLSTALASFTLAPAIATSTDSSIAANKTAPKDAIKDDHGLYVSGRILIKGKPGLSENKFLDLLTKHSAKRERKIKGADVSVVSVPPGIEKKVIEALKADPAVEFAELDRYMELTLTPNDPLFSSSWHHTTVNSPAAWDQASAQGVTIAMLDTGVDLTHPDLASALSPGWNVVSQNTDYGDYYGHGTSTAGATAAIFNNSVGVTGVAAGANILPVRITNDPNGYASSSSMADGIVWAAANGARVVNISYANTFKRSAVTAAADYFKSQGGIVVGAAGNAGIDEGYPEVPSMVIVSAINNSNTKASWSSYGDMVTVTAPGQSIQTTTRGGGYAYVSGTSIATPIVTGAVAMMMGANPNLSAAQIQNLLYSTTKDIGDVGKDKYYGHGVVDVAAAVAAAKTVVPADTAAPTASISSPTAGQTVQGTVVVNVAAGDNVGVSKVEFYVNGTLYATDIAAPYSFAWDTTPLNNLTNVSLTAKAYDLAGNSVVSTATKVNVVNTVDTIAPSPYLSTPTNGSVVNGNVSIQGGATDNVGVTHITLAIDGKGVANSTSGSISYTWNTRKVRAGQHIITITATDTSGNVAQHSVTVIR